MILCLGTTPTVQRTMTFERLTPNEVNRAKSVDEYASGKSVNVARVAHQLGAEVLELGFVGGDRGKFLRRRLDVDRVPHDFVTVPRSTRLCTTLIDEAGGTVTELVEESFKVPAPHWEELEAKFAAAALRASACVLSGSLPPDGPADFYARCVRLAGAGVTCVVDARGEPLRRAMREGQRSVIVKINRAELAATIGVELASDEDLRAGLRACVPPAAGVLVTMGADGAVACDGSRLFRLRSPQIDASNPIGSGDAVAAGVAVCLARGIRFEDACVFGVACGAANAMTPRAGYVRREDVERLVGEVRVTDL